MPKLSLTESEEFKPERPEDRTSQLFFRVEIVVEPKN